MIESYIKYLFMLICAFYCFIKISDIKFAKQHFFFNILTFLLSNTILYVIRLYIPHATMLTLFIIVFMHVTITYNKPFSFTAISSLISVALSYILFLASTICISPILLYLASKYSNIDSLYNSLLILIGIIQLSMAYGIFCIKRLRRGMPFLFQKASTGLAVFICCIIIFLTSIFTLLNNNDNFNGIIVLICIVLSFLLFIWWRKQISISYLNHAHNNEIARLDAEIEKLKKDNEHLAKLIHKDNKLIPAIEMAVKSLLTEQALVENNELHHKAATLLSDLNKLSAERTGILNTSINHRRSLPSTNLTRLDSVISYMYEKALSLDIKFDVSIETNINDILNHSISEDALVTLIADITENAIIAVKDCELKNIHLTLNSENNTCCINIFDSGIPFEAYTIMNAGKKRASTHLNTGGSGIGLMTTFSLLRECHASFVIDEVLDNTLYTKKVSVIFDKLNQFRIHTKRAEIIELKQNNPDIIITCNIQK